MKALINTRNRTAASSGDLSFTAANLPRMYRLQQYLLNTFVIDNNNKHVEPTRTYSIVIVHCTDTVVLVYTIKRQSYRGKHTMVCLSVCLFFCPSVCRIVVITWCKTDFGISRQCTTEIGFRLFDVSRKYKDTIKKNNVNLLTIIWLLGRTSSFRTCVKSFWHLVQYNMFMFEFFARIFTDSTIPY